MIIVNGWKSLNLYGNRFIGRADVIYDTAHVETEEGMVEVQQRIDERFYYIKDHLGSIRVTIDQTNQITAAQDYSAYGEIWRSLNSSTPGDRYKFTEKELDIETGYAYHGARYYDPWRITWNSPDPLEDVYAGYWSYNYCFGNPNILKDPSGMGPEALMNVGQKADSRTKVNCMNKSEKTKYPRNSKDAYSQALYPMVNEIKSFFSSIGEWLGISSVDEETILTGTSNTVTGIGLFNSIFLNPIAVKVNNNFIMLQGTDVALKYGIDFSDELAKSIKLLKGSGYLTHGVFYLGVVLDYKQYKNGDLSGPDFAGNFMCGVMGMVSAPCGITYYLLHKTGSIKRSVAYNLEYFGRPDLPAPGTGW